MWALRKEIEEPTRLRELQHGGQAEAALGAADPLGLYMREIGAIPLLTEEEEVVLAKSIERGRCAGERLDGPVGDEERVILLREREQGERARRRLIESNLRLVASIAGRYSGRGVPLSDLIEEGNLGLMRATEKFDWRRGYRFSTYATWWIRQAVTRGLANQSRVVRLPVHVSELINNVLRVSHRLSQALGRDPTSEEIAAEVGVTADRVREVVSASQPQISLDQPHGRDGEGVLGELVEDKGTGQPLDQVLARIVRSGVEVVQG